MKKRRKKADTRPEFSRLIGLSHRDILGFEFDYVLNEDERGPSLSSQPLALEMVDSLCENANSLPYEEFDLRERCCYYIDSNSNITGTRSPAYHSHRLPSQDTLIGVHAYRQGFGCCGD